MKTKCYFLNGKCINIGEWDEQRVPPRLIPAGKTVIPSVVYEGKVLAPAKEVVVTPESWTAEQVLNPVPAGATVEEREIVETKHGKFLATDYDKLRRDEYPSVRDQLDAVWKGGEDMEAMRKLVLGVKAQYPKPE